jgi:hypothetical protein
MEFKTAGASAAKDKVYAVDIDDVIYDLDHLDQVNHLEHPRNHIDWRIVYTKRHGDHWIRPSEKQPAIYTWKQLAAAFKVPMDWLRKHCQANLRNATDNNGGFDFDLKLEEKVPLKGKMVIPRYIQLMLVSQEILQDQTSLSLQQRCADIYYRF